MKFIKFQARVYIYIPYASFKNIGLYNNYGEYLNSETFKLSVNMKIK